MSKRKDLRVVTRRRFLQRLGVLTGAVVASQIPGLRSAAHAQPVAQGGYAGRVGVLLPQSAMNPLLSPNLVSGLKLGFQTAGCPDVTLITSPCGPGPAAAATCAERLMDQERVDLVTGIASPNLSAEFRAAFENRRKYYVAADGGANLVRTSEESPYVLYNSLHYWQSNWATGQWAAKHLGTKAVVVSSFYETGYDAFSAFRLGFEAGGGEVAETYVTHRPASDWTWESVMSGIRTTAPDLLFALYSGQQATEFLAAWAESGLAGQIPLAASPFMVDEAALAEQGDAALGIISCLPWAPGLDHAENQAFVTAFLAMTGRRPDGFALLGYDTARLIANALGANGGGLTANLRWSSPRGAVKLDGRSQSVVTPLYLREVRRGADGLYNAVIGTIAPADDRDDRLEPLRSGERTGWLNAYLQV